MDTITIIMTAITVGIAAGAKPVAEQLIKDTYLGLKQIIQDRYKVSLTNLEKNPNSDAQKMAIRESLNDTDADSDEELLIAAKTIIDNASKNMPELVIGVNLEEVEAEFIRIQRTRSSGTGVNIHNAKIRGGIDISDTNAGTNDDTNPN